LDEAVEEGAFAHAELEAKGAQGALIEAGDKEGSKLAFAALLSARKGNLEALKGSVARIREIARIRDASLEGRDHENTRSRGRLRQPPHDA
jgi:hypothetical protein